MQKAIFQLIRSRRMVFIFKKNNNNAKSEIAKSDNNGKSEMLQAQN